MPAPAPRPLPLADGSPHRALRGLGKTLALFTRTATRCVEARCFWYGTRATDGPATVRGVVVASQRNSGEPLHSRSGDGGGSRDNATPRLAEPGAGPHYLGLAVEHSRYDDEYVNCRRAFSLSCRSTAACRAPGDWVSAFTSFRTAIGICCPIQTLGGAWPSVATLQPIW